MLLITHFERLTLLEHRAIIASTPAAMHIVKNNINLSRDDSRLSTLILPLLIFLMTVIVSNMQ